jgi:hypothetical protein
MKRLNSKSGFKLTLLSIVLLTLCGCSRTLEQQAQTVRVSPVSEEYKLTERLTGKVFILLAETSTGQEQHRYSVSDSLARALKEDLSYGDDSLSLAFLGLGEKPDVERISTEGIQVLSFTDFANILNEKDLCQKHAEMRKFYQQNGMFRKSDLQFLTNEIGADYIILPCLLDIKRWSTGRLSVVGVKFLHTQIVNGMLGMEIWDTRKGRKVFSATSDVTIANECIAETPISMDEAFERAWLGILRELPGQSQTSTVTVDKKENEMPLVKEDHTTPQNTTNEKKEEFSKVLEVSSKQSR